MVVCVFAVEVRRLHYQHDGAGMHLHHRPGPGHPVADPATPVRAQGDVVQLPVEARQTHDGANGQRQAREPHAGLRREDDAPRRRGDGHAEPRLRQPRGHVQARQMPQKRETAE